MRWFPELETKSKLYDKYLPFSSQMLWLTRLYLLEPPFELLAHL